MIDVKGLLFAYPGKREDTLRGLDFSIGAGEVFGFLGPSGAGKSTAQKVLIGILKNYRGSVRIMGKEMYDQDASYYERIGVAFEFPNLYSKFTARENLAFFGSLYNRRLPSPDSLLERLDLAEDADTRVAQFSKGMKMRLALIRAMLHDPDILFLDEPTSGLDPVNAKVVKDLILEKKGEGKAVFLTTHNMNVAEDICDRVAFIVDGKICLTASPRELKLENGKRRVRVEYSGDKGTEAGEFDLSSLGNDARFLDLIRSRRIETIHTQEASLDEVFISVTGRGLA